MQTNQIPTSKATLWATLAPFIRLLPLNTAFVVSQELCFPDLVGRKDPILVKIIAIILSLLVGYRFFHFYKKISINNAIICEFILTSALILFRMFEIESFQILSLILFCIYSAIWPLLKLRYQIYLHQYSQASNTRFIYSLAICLQMLPNIFSKMIPRSDSDKTIFGLPGLFFLLLAFLTSYVLCDILPGEISSSSPDVHEPISFEERKKAIKNVFSNPRYFHLLVICLFCGMNYNKANAFFITRSDNEFSTYDLTGPFYGDWKFLTLCLVGRLLLIISAGKLLDRFNKAKILYITVVLSFLAMLLFNFSLVTASSKELRLISVSGLWGCNELVYLVVQVIISGELKGSPELFLVSNAFFCGGDLIKKSIDLMGLGGGNSGWLILSYIIVQIIILGLYLYVFQRFARRKSQKNKMKL